MDIWDDILTERDKQVFTDSGYGSTQGFGERPVLLIIDVNYNFVGETPEPILESIQKFRNSCGEEGWEAVSRIRKLLPAARDKGIPVSGIHADRLRAAVDSGMRVVANLGTEPQVLYEACKEKVDRVKAAVAEAKAAATR